MIMWNTLCSIGIKYHHGFKLKNKLDPGSMKKNHPMPNAQCANEVNTFKLL